MNGVVFAAFIIVAFFAAGVALGVTTIISLSATGRRRRRTGPRWADPANWPADAEPGLDPDDPDGTSRWPDTAYRG